MLFTVLEQTYKDMQISLERAAARQQPTATPHQVHTIDTASHRRHQSPSSIHNMSPSPSPSPSPKPPELITLDTEQTQETVPSPPAQPEVIFLDSNEIQDIQANQTLPLQSEPDKTPTDDPIPPH